MGYFIEMSILLDIVQKSSLKLNFDFFLNLEKFILIFLCMKFLQKIIFLKRKLPLNVNVEIFLTKFTPLRI